jgi:Trypsin
MGSTLGRSTLDRGRIAGILTVVALVFALITANARAQEAKPVAKVAPGVYISKVSAEANKSDEVRSKSEPGQVLEAKRTEGPSSRIVGGTPTTIAQWPWQSAILFDAAHSPPGADGFDRQFCGGSLVAPNAVISAAHCVFDVAGTPDGAFDPVFFDVVTGRTVLSSTQGQELPVSGYFFFTDAAGTPLFDGDPSHGWDAILIQLSSASVSETINLAGPNETAAWAPGAAATATGWGALNEGPPQVFPDDLRQVQVPIIADSTCGSSTVNDGLFIPQLMVCAGVLAGGKDTCQGDSGGPLVVPIAGGEFRLVGDTSFGLGCARPSKPGVYGRIAADPMLHGLAETTEAISGVNIIGTCADDQAKAKKAKKKAKKAKKKFKKSATEQAKKKYKKAKKKAKKAKKKAKKAC